VEGLEDAELNPDSSRSNENSGCAPAPGRLNVNTKEPRLLLLESVDEALADLLGKRAREAIYDYLERKCYMSTNEIPERLGEFCSLLLDNFGRGSKTIEKAVAKRFYAKLGKEFTDVYGLTLEDYVKKANLT
jgi:hypothetical protein